ncbi:MAG: alpha/beta hydrolase [Rikenellaceae bacterium]
MMKKTFFCFAMLIGFTLPASSQNAKKLSKTDSEQATLQLIEERQAASLAEFGDEWDNGELTNGDYTMKFYYKVFGEKPSDGRAMYISMHGGGGTTAQMNDGQWNNQKGLYTPEEGVYFVPRSPTNTWNMWHQGYMDGFIEKIIEMAVIKEGVNPNKVYIMGYSAGGDGTYQLAPRLADLWAAAAMSAGHPGDAQIRNLRNLPFGLYMGGKDTPYDRNKHAAEWKEELKTLADSDEGSYIHDVRIYSELAHWMERNDTVSMHWMPKYTRNPIPNRVVWLQDDITRERFYWLSTTGDNDARQNDELVVSYKDNNIYIENSSITSFVIGLNDDMVDLDKKIKVYKDDKVIFSGKVNRYLSNIKSDVNAMRDASLVFPAKLLVRDTEAWVIEK